MFILNNSNDRNYRKLYPDLKNIVFDISDKQLNNAKNAIWKDISEGDIVCVVTSTKKVSTFFVIDSNVPSGCTDGDSGETYIVTGHIVAKTKYEEDMTTLFNRHEVSHVNLPKNKFSVGVVVADVGESLDQVPVKTSSGATTVGEIEA